MSGLDPLGSRAVIVNGSLTLTFLNSNPGVNSKDRSGMSSYNRYLNIFTSDKTITAEYLYYLD
jgi:hypothetical protein